MNHGRSLALLVSLLSLVACALGGCQGEQAPSPAAAAPAPLSVQGFSAPESALYDDKNDLYFVSNISGDPFTSDHDGFISRVAPDGTIAALRFIDGRASRDGLSAPKGMALVGRTLFVADIDRVRSFDADTAAAGPVVEVPGASLLNDICPGPDGTLYVTDTGIRREGDKLVATGTDAVYALRAGGPARRIAGGDLGRPNGITWGNGALEVVTLGSGEWLTLSPDGAVLGRTKLPGAMLDGVLRLDSGDLLASSWDSRGVYLLHRGAAPQLILSAPSPADIGFDTRRRRVLVPIMTEDRLLLAPLPR